MFSSKKLFTFDYTLRTQLSFYCPSWISVNAKILSFISGMIFLIINILIIDKRRDNDCYWEFLQLIILIVVKTLASWFLFHTSIKLGNRIKRYVLCLKLTFKSILWTYYVLPGTLRKVYLSKKHLAKADIISPKLLFYLIHIINI